MGVNNGKKKQDNKCNTVIPREWPQLTAPAYNDRMGYNEARSLHFAFLREQRKVQPTPRVYRRSES